MKPLKKFINLQNKTNIKLIDTKIEPPKKIKGIYRYILEKLNKKTNDVLENPGIDNEPFQQKELMMAGGCLTELFIKGWQGKEKGYIFYISDRWLGIGNKMTNQEKDNKGIPYKQYTHKGEVYLEDVLDELFGEKNNTPTAELDKYENFFNNRKTYEFSERINQEEVQIQILLTENQQLNFDLGIREFYYRGDTILASSKALRDIENNEITINSIKSPIQTCFRLKEFEKRYNLKASKPEKETLLHFIKNGYENGERRMIFDEGKIPEYHSEERMGEILKEIENTENWNKYYTKSLHKILCRDLLSRKCNEHIIFERIRMIKELGYTEEQLREGMVFDIPRWTPQKEFADKYNEVKEQMIDIIREYNKKNKINYLYEDKTTLWLESEANELLAKNFNGSSSQIKLLRLLLFLDKTIPEKDKILVDETKQNNHYGEPEWIKKMVDITYIELKINDTSIYLQEEIIFNKLYSDYSDRKFFLLEYESDGLLQVSPKYKLSSKGMKYSFIDNERELALREKMNDYLMETEKNDIYKYL